MLTLEMEGMDEVVARKLGQKGMPLAMVQ